MQINQMRWAGGVSALLVLAAWPAAAGAQMFGTVEEAVADAKSRVASDERGRLAGIVLFVQTDDETPRRIDGAIVQGGGLRSVFFSSGTASVTVVPAGDYLVRLRVDGYHEFEQTVRVQPGEVLVLDDIWLEPVGPQDAIEILGMVKLEDGASAEGIRVRAGESSCETDAHGRFRLSGIGAGEIRISASKEGYEGMYKTVHVKRGEKPTVVIEGWRKRYALVRWGYQPDGSRDLSSGLESGEAILDSRQLHRVSFKEGFADVDRDSDFLVYQRSDKLTIHNMDYGPGRPAIMELPDIEFDEVRKVPEVEFPKRHHELREGAVYLFKCYDGEHFAKMQVLQIIDSERNYMRLIADMARE